MRFYTIVAALLLLVSLTNLASASHACWTSLGVAPGAAAAIDFDADSSNAYIVRSESTLYRYSSAAAPAWSALGSIAPAFTPQVVGIVTTGALVAAGQGGCPAGVARATCARLYHVSPSPFVSVAKTFTIDGFSPTSDEVSGTQFKRYVKAGSNRFIVGDSGVVFQFAAACTPATDWCGKQVVPEEITAYFAEDSNLIIGTASGKVYRVVSGPTATLIGQPPGAGAAIAVAKTSAGLFVKRGFAVYFLPDGVVAGATWRLMGDNFLFGGTARDLVDINSAVYSASANTYAFTDHHTTLQAERYTPLPEPTGTVRLVKTPTSSIYAFSLSSANLYSFNCGASPTVANAGPDQNIQLGNDVIIDPSSFSTGSGAGHALAFNWTPNGFNPSEVFTTYQITSAGALKGLNARQTGRFTFTLTAFYNGFPNLNSTDNVTVKIATGGEGVVMPAPGPGGDLCADAVARCGAVDACDAVTGACIAPGAAGPGGAGDVCADALERCGAVDACDPATGECIAPGAAGPDLCADAVDRCGGADACDAATGACIAPGAAGPGGAGVDICADALERCGAEDACDPATGDCLVPGGAGGGAGGGGGGGAEGISTGTGGISTGTGGEAGVEVECPEGQVARGSRCYPTCTTDEDCSATSSCDPDGACVPLRCTAPTPLAADHQCTSQANLLQCQGLRVRGTGVCCSGTWIPGASSCPGGNQTSTQRPAVATGFDALLPYLVVGVIILLLILGAVIYLLTRKPAAEKPAEKTEKEVEKEKEGKPPAASALPDVPSAEKPKTPAKRESKSSSAAREKSSKQGSAG